MRIKIWNEENFGKMTFENICRLYSSDKNISFTKKPPFIRAYYANDSKNQYAVRWNKHENNADFSGWCAEQTRFVLNGECEITVEQTTYHLRKGDYIELPTGNYHFKLIGNGPFEYILVCKLPDYLPKIENNGDAFR